MELLAPMLIPMAAAALTSAAAVATGTVTVASAIVSVATTALVAGASYLMRPNSGAAPAQEAAAAAPANQQRNIPVAQAIPPRRFAYGEVRTGGALFYQDNENPYLYVGVVLSDGEIDAVLSVLYGDEAIPLDANGDAVSSSRFNGKLKMETTVGDDSQAASPLLLSGFPTTLDSTFRQQGVARTVMRMHWGDDAANHQALWGNSISPSFAIRGVKVYDPRDHYQSFDDPGTWEYRDNPVLCIAHFLTHVWGSSISYEDIDWASVADAADVCDQTVTYNDQTLPIFTLAGIVQSDVELGRQLQDMLGAFRGGITYQDGKYGIIADEASDSVWTIEDADILGLREHSFANEMRAVFNAISAVYYDADDSGRRTTTEPYELTDTSVQEEGLRETAITLPFTNRTHSAQIIAYRELVDGRDGRRLVLHLTDAALWLTPRKDVVTLNLTTAAFLNGTYRVQQVDPQTFGVYVTLKGYSAAPYADPATYLV